VLVVVLVVVFVLVVLPVFVVELVVVEFIVVLPPVLPPVFDIGDMVAAGDEVVMVLVVVLVTVLVTVLVLLVFALLVFDSPGQAAPNKPNVKTAERAITFFISIIFSCLLQRMFLIYCLTTVLKQSCSIND
jgi:hypothetical protein